MKTIIGSLCGANDWDAIVLMCESRLDWLRGFQMLDNGIPSSDTFKRVLSRISLQQIEVSLSEMNAPLILKFRSCISLVLLTLTDSLL